MQVLPSVMGRIVMIGAAPGSRIRQAAQLPPRLAIPLSEVVVAYRASTEGFVILVSAAQRLCSRDEVYMEVRLAATLAARQSAPVVIRMGVTPVPVIILLTPLCSCKVVILFMMFLEVAPVRLILICIPFVGIIVSLIFVAPRSLVGLGFVVPVVALLGADQQWNNQGRTDHHHFEIAIHDVFLLKSLSNAIATPRTRAYAEHAQFWLCARSRTSPRS